MEKRTILVVDDDKDFVEALRVVLEFHGYKITSANTKEEAFERIKTISPALIILDVMLQGMSDGFDMAMSFKNDKNYKQIPIIMLTSIGEKVGFHFNANIDKEKWLPVDAYFEKEVDHHILITEIEKLLSR